MKKRLLSLLLAAVLLCALLPAQAADIQAFTDVSNGSWYAPYVYALVGEGIINGMTDTTFAPAEPLTRAQLMKMLASYAADDETIRAAADRQQFSDVKSASWYAGYVNWAAEQGVTDGYEDGTFGPNRGVTRAETVTLAARFAAVAGIELKATAEKADFTDDAAIPGWAKESVYLCQQAGIVNGYEDGTFRGGKEIVRSEAAKVLCVLLGVEPLPKDELPVNPVAEVRTISGTVAGCSVTGVEFDPRAYRAGIVLANDRFYATESASSMVQRSGALIACNGAFFANNGDLTTASAMIRNGRALRIENSHAGKTCYFVVDSGGRASMQFLKILQTATLLRDGEELYRYEEVGCNYALGENDGSRMIFTPEFGKTVPVKMKCAVYCDANGVVTATLDSETAQTISIPQNGFVLCSAHRRDEGTPYRWDNFFEEARPGDRVALSLSYENSSVQDIAMAFSCGPTVVKNGQAYGSRETYIEEGVTESHVISGSAARMAIGVKQDGTVVMASATCDLQTLGRIMQALGCETAMNLDGGASRALYVGGSARIAPGRNLTHLIVFTRR